MNFGIILRSFGVSISDADIAATLALIHGFDARFREMERKIDALYVKNYLMTDMDQGAQDAQFRLFERPMEGLSNDTEGSQNHG